jgi:uncharacterized protein YcaQ
MKWAQDHPKVMKKVRMHLRKNGAVRSAEFENSSHVPGGWWNWKEEKDALETLLFTGEVMVARRQNFQRVYDLRERILPGWDDAVVPSREDVQRTLTLRTVRALGIAFPSWVPDYLHDPKKGISKLLDALAREHLLIQVEVKGFEELAYIHPDHADLVEAAIAGDLEPTRTTLLSPFDPLIWDRKRALELFDFDYKIECYTPAAKRRYGYFTLPILHHGRLIGRLDPKAHRAQGIFEIKAVHVEPNVRLTKRLIADLAAALHDLAAWHGTPNIMVSPLDPTEAAILLKAAL